MDSWRGYIAPKYIIQIIIFFAIFNLSKWGIDTFIDKHGLEDAKVQHIDFAFDDEGLLYVGKSNRIDVYDNGELVNTVLRAYSGYRFTIEDEKIYILADGRVYVRDLLGNEIERIERKEDNEIVQDWERKLRNRGNLFTQYKVTKGDEEYISTNWFGNYKIERVIENGENEVIYQIPKLDYVFKILLMLLWISFVVFCLVMVFLVVRDNFKRDREIREKKIKI